MSNTPAPRSILRSIGTVGGAAVVAQLIALAASPLISRLFTQEELGQFGLFFNLANVLVTIALLGLTDAILAASSDDDAVALLGTALHAIVSFSPLLALANYAMIRFDVLGYGALPAWSAAVMIPEIIAVGAVMVLQMWLIRAHDFSRIGQGHVVLGVTRAASQLAAGAAGMGFGGLAAGETLSRVAVTWTLGRGAGSALRRALGQSVQQRLAALKTYWRFPAFRTPSMLLNNIGTALPPALVAMAYGVEAAGLFTLMYGVLVAPASLVQKAVGDVFLGHFSQQYRTDRARAQRFLVQTGAALLAMSIVPALLLFFAGPAVFAWMFGAQWRAAGVLASRMVPALVADFVVGPLSGALSVANRPDSKLWFDAARIGGYVAAYSIAVQRQQALESMVTLMAAFTFVSYLFYAALIAHAVRNPRAVRSATSGSPATEDLPLP